MLLALSLISALVSNYLVEKAAENKTFEDIASLPNNRVALLLGTSKMLKDNYPNPYYENRIAASVELMKAGKIKFLVVSGDNGSVNYDEPTAMRADLIARGVDSTVIFLDYAGFRTLDSVIRLKEIFGQDSVTIISQKFHNERAIFIAQNHGMIAVGFNAEDVSGKFGIRVHMREYLARVKVILDKLFGVGPKFLGKKISIPE